MVQPKDTWSRPGWKLCFDEKKAIKLWNKSTQYKTGKFARLGWVSRRMGYSPYAVALFLNNRKKVTISREELEVLFEGGRHA